MLLNKIILSKKQKILFYVSIIVLLAAFTDRFIFSGLRSRLKIPGNRIKIEEVRLKENLIIQKNQAQYTEDYEYCKPYIEQQNFEEEQLKGELFREMEDIVKNSGGTIITMVPHEISEKTNIYIKYKSDLRLEMDFKQLIKLLDNISKSKLLIKLDKINIKIKNAKTALLNVEGVISIIGLL